MSEWCQNRKCPQKKNQNQIRGSKGAKYYQSNKASGYYEHWCSMGCRETWFQEHKDTCMNAVGFIDKQVLPLDDAWFVEYKYGSYDWDNERQERVEVTPAGYYLINKLKGIRRAVPQQQAQTPEQISDGHVWRHIDDTEARELAITLGLAS
jgi:hypothetical protein